NNNNNMANVFILDNGAYSIKGGFSNQNEPRIMPNAIMKAKSERRRPFIADQVEDCRDASGLFYILPFQKLATCLSTNTIGTDLGSCAVYWWSRASVLHTLCLTSKARSRRMPF
ncbi:hypothetical protein OTU49_012340, partial [Cherax quadricarinatus]